MNALAGTGSLIRLILRRDRVALPVWILVIAALGVSVASSFITGYPTVESRQAYVNEIASSPAEVAMLGYAYAPSVGGLAAWRWTVQGVLLIGLASLLTVIRHTRTEEEAGRRELLGAGVVGRHAALTAALAVTFGADLAVGLIVGGGLAGLGLPAAGSFALGLSVAAAGWVCAALGGLAAQLAQSAGGARAMAGYTLGAFYLLRALGDSGAQPGASWLSWLSPMGWARFTRPFAGEQWGVFGLFLGLTAVLAAAAYALSARRDLGAGLLHERLGPAAASPGLRSPLALAWRLQRGALLAWAAGFAVIGTLFGFVARTATEQIAANPDVMNFLTQVGGKSGISDAVFTLYLIAFGPVYAVYAIQAALRLRSEEVEQRAEPVLATAASRLQWAGSHLIVMALGSAVVLASFGLTAGLTYGLSSGSVGSEFLRVLAATMAYLPAVWALGGLAVALFGWLPRLTALSWAALGVCMVLELGGEFHLLSQGLLDLSPFAHVPKLLVSQGVSALPLVWLALAAVVLVAAGLVGFQRREIG